MIFTSRHSRQKVKSVESKEVATVDTIFTHAVDSVYDGESIIKHAAKSVFHFFKSVFYTAASVVQLITNGFAGIYEKPSNIKEAASSVGETVKDLATAADKALDFTVDGVSLVVKGLGEVAAFVAPKLASAAEAAIDSVGGVIANALKPSVKIEADTEMTTFSFNSGENYELFGGGDDDSLFNQEVTLRVAGNVFDETDAA